MVQPRLALLVVQGGDGAGVVGGERGVEGGEALLLGVFCYRMLKADHATLVRRVPMAGAISAYVWFNLMLLRTAAQVLDIDYSADVLFASQFIQAMLSLVWSVTALVLMRRAVSKGSRRQWMIGAGFLALVVVGSTGPPSAPQAHGKRL